MVVVVVAVVVVAAIEKVAKGLAVVVAAGVAIENAAKGLAEEEEEEEEDEVVVVVGGGGAGTTRLRLILTTLLSFNSAWGAFVNTPAVAVGSKARGSWASACRSRASYSSRRRCPSVRTRLAMKVRCLVNSVYNFEIRRGCGGLRSFF